jgi:hypothetical protein
MTYLKAKLPIFGVVAIALVTMLFSASCGCGSGSSGVAPSTPTPTTDVTNPGDDWPWEPPGYTYDPWQQRTVSGLNADVLHQRWALGSNYIEEVGYHRVARGGSAEFLGDWGKLEFTPYNRDEGQVLASDMAYAVYGLSSYNFSDESFYPIYVELDWDFDPAPADVWIGLHTDRYKDSTWNWQQPYSDGSVQVDPLWLYQAPDSYGTVYIAVVVTGGPPSVLKEVRLRQYRY